MFSFRLPAGLRANGSVHGAMPCTHQKLSVPCALCALCAQVYLMWGDDGMADGAAKTGAGLTYIPAPRPQLPGHEESYNPPAEYLPTEVREAEAKRAIYIFIYRLSCPCPLEQPSLQAQAQARGGGARACIAPPPLLWGLQSEHGDGVCPSARVCAVWPRLLLGIAASADWVRGSTEGGRGGEHFSNGARACPVMLYIPC